MKPTEAYSAGIFPRSDGWMDADQVASNREKWRASVEHLGDRWVFMLEQKRIGKPAAPVIKIRKQT